MSVKSGSLRFFIVFSCLAMLFGCNGEGEDENPANDLIGAWTVNFIEFIDCEDPSDNQQDANIICTSTDCRKYEFKSDGVFSAIDIYDSDRDVETGTYVVDGSQLSITIDNETIALSYTIEDNTLSMKGTEPDSGCIFEIRLVKD